MIVKTISIKTSAAVGNAVRYILAEHKVTPAREPKPTDWRHVPVHLSKSDIDHLMAERSDAILLAEMRKHPDLNIQAFVQQYILGGKNDLNERLSKPVIITNGLRSSSVPGYIKEFQENEKLRQHARKDSIKAYHHIVSFSKLDNQHVTEKMLRDIAQKYISLRGPDCLFLAAVHTDRDHSHLHLIQSGVKVGTGLSARISKQEFLEIKRTLQEFQKDKYRETVRSIVDHGKSRQQKSKNMEAKNVKTHERQEGERTLTSILKMAYATSSSKAEFLDQLRQLGHEPYERNGRIAGIRYNGDDKYRLTRFGLDDKALNDLDLKVDEKKELQSLRSGREQPLDRMRAFDKAREQADKARPLDKYERDEIAEEKAMVENAHMIEREQEQDNEREQSAISPSDFADAEIDNNDIEQEDDDREIEQDDDRDQPDEWSFDHADDAYDIDR